MEIERNYNRCVSVKRLTATAGTENEQYDTHIEKLACHIQPLEDAYGEDLQGSFGKDWLMFCKVSDILENDLVVDGSVEYRVVAVESFAFLGRNRHMEVRIRRFIKEGVDDES